ncbi:aspartyl/asparaginyl beta-hydroxylase domain-containing protein [Parahaliea mediterranea]|uniref:Aspartyl/asparaginyl beta-hydroxylase domain-containing protein n=2 Tax=Parahaliea mediterranea TaxID=651086 RepID=A0A939DIZ7_9GAMM|nr:aspartyl/asparaginyl beta-hydroxylase domain-containing protein [Parahaliea mediterranea]
MSTAVTQLQQQGLQALRTGNAADAERLFLQAIDSGGSDAALWLALAFARVNQGHAATALEAVDQALSVEPRNLRALLFKADHLDRMGEKRAALGYYQAALKVAAGEAQVPRDVAQALRRAAEVCGRQARDYEDFLRRALSEHGADPATSPRFAESLEIAFGKQPLQLQQPTRYCFPGLPQQAFYPREQFSWVAELEAQTDVIREELERVLEDPRAFEPYLQTQHNQPKLNNQQNLDSMDWSACYLWREGALNTGMAQRCPRTVEALSRLPLCQIPGQMPSVLFSRLSPGATIVPHYGAVNTRLICHLPLIVPPDCGALRVGNYQRPWREGELLIFDDSMEHEAWNPSARERVVLLFDIWRPELNEEERQWVSRMLQAVKAYEAG